MNVFVAGGTGVLGSRLVTLLVAAGHRVAAMTRSRAQAHDVLRQGAEPVVCNVYDEPALTRALADFAPDVTVNLLTSFPPRAHPRTLPRQMAATNRLRSDGTARLVRAAAAAGARRFVSQSAACAYDPDAGSPAAESDLLYVDAPATFAGIVRALAASEHAVRGAPGMEGVVLRYGFLYGPDTAYGPAGSFAGDVRRWRVPIIADGAGTWSFVHVDDAASATFIAVTRGAPGVYNVVDDEPAEAREWLPYYAELLDAPRPLHLPALLGRLAAGPYGVHLMTRMPGASNDLARAALGWQPRFPSWRTGFERTLTAEAAA
jgi:nucleoside-diphosphate-sugar epimerase